MVFEASRSRDDDGRLAAKLGDLPPHALASDEPRSAYSEQVENFLDLVGELSGRGDDERHLTGLQPRNDRQSKRERLAGSRLGDADKVHPFEGRRNGLGLDWSGGYKSGSIQFGEDCRR